jgi:hypothetical protein
VLVRGGPQASKFVLPERVIYDPAFVDRRDAFRMLTVVSLDTDESFPPEPPLEDGVRVAERRILADATQKFGIVDPSPAG